MTSPGRKADAYSGKAYKTRSVPKHHSTFDAKVDGLLQDLNKPSKAFDKIPAIIPDLVDFVSKLHEEGAITERSYLGQLGHLRWFEENKRPYYKPIKRSSRLYPVGPGLGLKREVREELKKKAGWMKADLRSAQLVVVAKKWVIRSLQKRLNKAQSFWDYLSCQLGFSDKDLFKESTYAIVFGASTTKCTKGGPKTMWKKAGKEADYSRFAAIPEIADLIKAAKRRKDEISKAICITDAFGKTYRLDYSQKIDTECLMAMEVQSYEMAMMLDVADVVLTDSRAHITMWLHDGFYFSYSREPSRLKVFIKKIEGSVSRWIKQGYRAKVIVE